MVHHALPSLSNKKIFETLDFKATQQFFARHQKQIKDLMTLSKQVSQLQQNSRQLVKALEEFMGDKPCGLTRLVYEKMIFPADFVQQQQDPQALHPRNYFFFGSQLQIKIVDFLKTEITEQFPYAAKSWDDEHL